MVFIDFIVKFMSTYLITFIIYQIFFISPFKRNKKLKGNNKEILEIRYLISKYRFNIKKVNYNQLLQIVAIVSSFDISLIVTIEMLFVNGLFQILIVVILVLPIFIISYSLVAKFYKKKGMIKDV